MKKGMCTFNHSGIDYIIVTGGINTEFQVQQSCYLLYQSTENDNSFNKFELPAMNFGRFGHNIFIHNGILYAINGLT